MAVFVVWILVGVVFVATLGLWVALGLTNRYRKIPHFFWNQVGSQIAFCATSDFYVAKKKGHPVQTPGGRDVVVVNETFSFHSGCVDSNRKCEWFYPRAFQPELFVPFASHSINLPEEINFLHQKYLDQGWIRKKQEQNKSHFFRMRFAEEQYRISEWLLWCLTILFVLLVFAFLGQSHLNGISNNERIVSVYLTDDNGEVYEVSSKRKDAHKLLVLESPNRTLFKGTVQSAQTLSSNMHRACVVSKNQSTLCGFVAPSLVPQKGDTVYLRVAEFMHSLGKPRIFGVWVVPDKDAQNLIRSGFAVEE